LRHLPADPELLFHEATLLLETSRAAEAEAGLLRWLQLPPSPDLLAQDPQLPSKARHNLAYLYMTQGRAAEAEAQLRTILAEQPDYLAAWQGLGQLGLNQGQWDRVEEAAAQLRQDPRTALDGLVLQARGLLARKDFAGARRALEEAAARAPRHVRVHQLLA